MVDNRNIVYIVSYPKSGNTWFRVLLNNFFSESDEPISINSLESIPISSKRSIIDGYLGVHSSDLSIKEIRNYFPEVIKQISEESTKNLYFKTHDAWEFNDFGKPIFSTEKTKGVIYIIRNPLDVVISLAFHSGSSFETTITNLNNNENGLCVNKNKLLNQIPQNLFSWSNHVISWVHKSGLPIHIIKYEDLILDPNLSFTRALQFLSIEHSHDSVVQAIKNSTFQVLRQQEEENDFKERSIFSNNFFRAGTVNSWKEYLTKSQIRSIIKHHHQIMNEYGYLKEIQ